MEETSDRCEMDNQVVAEVVELRWPEPEPEHDPVTPHIKSRVSTATVFENQRYHKSKLDWLPVKANEPVPQFGSGPEGMHAVPITWASSRPHMDAKEAAPKVEPNVELKSPWKWVDEEWTVSDWEYASSWKHDFVETKRFFANTKFVRRRRWTRVLANEVDVEKEEESTPLPMGVRHEDLLETNVHRVDHLVLIVHGIGVHGEDKMERRKRTAEEMLHKVLGPAQARRAHVAFEYIRWHENLHYTQGLNSTIDMITPQGAGTVRHKARDTVLGGLAYMGGYAEDITAAVIEQLNLKHALFKASHPNFAQNGGVTLLCHSLGSAIVFDVLAGLSATHDRSHLDFSVTNFIAVGSPVGALTACRRLNPGEIAGHVNQIVGPGTRYFNIFHRCDPVAYRVEPLIFGALFETDPICIDEDIGTMPQKAPPTSRPRSASVERPSVSVPRSPSLEPSSSPPRPPIDERWLGVAEGAKGPIGMLRDAGVTDLRDRIDYEIRPGHMDLAAVSESLSSLTAHRSYWTNMHLFRFLVHVLQVGSHPPVTESLEEEEGSCGEAEDHELELQDDDSQSDNDGWELSPASSDGRISEGRTLHVHSRRNSAPELITSAAEKDSPPTGDDTSRNTSEAAPSKRRWPWQRS